MNFQSSVTVLQALAVEKCSICLDPLNKKTKPKSCSHLFCLHCILEWTKICSFCPLCKAEMKYLYRYEIETKFKNKVKTQVESIAQTIRIKIKKQEYEGTELLMDQADACYECGIGDDKERLLICAQCEYKVCHYFCLGYDSKPLIRFICKECIEQNKKPKKKKKRKRRFPRRRKQIGAKKKKKKKRLSKKRRRTSKQVRRRKKKNISRSNALMNEETKEETNSEYEELEEEEEDEYFPLKGEDHKSEDEVDEDSEGDQENLEFLRTIGESKREWKLVWKKVLRERKQGKSITLNNLQE